MNIESTPQQYASVFGQACFTISGIEDQQCDVEILRYDTGKSLGTKRFRGTSSCRVNVAPYMRAQLDVKPMNDLFSGTYPSGRTASCAIMCEEILSEPVIMTAAATEITTGKLLSDITSVRTIGKGEWDELSFAAPFAIVSVNVIMYGAQADASIALTGEQLGQDIITTVLRTDDMAEMFAEQTGKKPEELEGFTVEIYADYVHVATLNYRVDDSTGGMRLGWLNRYGVMDYFTFPVVCSRSLAVEKSRVLSGEGYRISGMNTEESAVISSGYRPTDEIRALAAILSSPAVWQIEKDTLTRMDVTTAAMERMRYGQPTEIKITLRNAQSHVPQITQ